MAANAPKFFTLSQDGSGFIIATHADANLITRQAPVKTGETIVLYMNGLGEVTPAVAAGAATGDGVATPLNKTVDATSVTIDGLPAKVTYAGLAPGFPGLYQVNFLTPYDDKVGDSALQVKVGTAVTQSGVTVPVRANGLYWIVTAGKVVNGQTFNGLPGSNSSIAVRHNSAEAFGTGGLNGWSKATGFSTTFAGVTGLALTLKSGSAIVYDNNGIETATAGAYYSSVPGSNVLFSMSNLSSPTAPQDTLKGLYSGYFKLTSAATVDQMIGYFEGPENVVPPFDPANAYNAYRMNIYSNVGGAPKETGGFTGDVFTSDTATGTFAYSKMGVDRVGQDGIHYPIYRTAYTLKTPVMLAAGEYWFSHDVATPASAASGTAGNAPVFETRAERAISLRPKGGVK